MYICVCAVLCVNAFDSSPARSLSAWRPRQPRRGRGGVPLQADDVHRLADRPRARKVAHGRVLFAHAGHERQHGAGHAHALHAAGGRCILQLLDTANLVVNKPASTQT